MCVFVIVFSIGLYLHNGAYASHVCNLLTVAPALHVTQRIVKLPEKDAVLNQIVLYYWTSKGFFLLCETLLGEMKGFYLLQATVHAFLLMVIYAKTTIIEHRLKEEQQRAEAIQRRMQKQRKQRYRPGHVDSEKDTWDTTLDTASRNTVLESAKIVIKWWIDRPEMKKCNCPALFVWDNYTFCISDRSIHHFITQYLQYPAFLKYYCENRIYLRLEPTEVFLGKLLGQFSDPQLPGWLTESELLLREYFSKDSTMEQLDTTLQDITVTAGDAQTQTTTRMSTAMPQKHDIDIVDLVLGSDQPSKLKINIAKEAVYRHQLRIMNPLQMPVLFALKADADLPIQATPSYGLLEPEQMCMVSLNITCACSVTGRLGVDAVLGRVDTTHFDFNTFRKGEKMSYSMELTYHT